MDVVADREWRPAVRAGSGVDAAKAMRTAANKAGSKWYVIDVVHDGDAVFFANVVYAADDPTFRFFDPKDYPRLPGALVESANARYRKAHRVYERTMVVYDFKYWNALYREEERAINRMAIHRHKPWETGGVLIANVGGFIVDSMPPESGHAQTDWIGEMVLDLVQLRAARDFETADALRREIALGARAVLFIGKDGVEFLTYNDGEAG